MKNIFLNLFLVLAVFSLLVCSVSAGTYYYGFDSDIEGIKTFDVESYSTSLGTLAWSSDYGGSLQMHGGASGSDLAIGNTTQFFGVGDKLVVNFVLNEAFATNNEIGLHFAFCNESYTGTGLDFDVGCTQTYRYNPIVLTNQSGNLFYDDDIYHYVFAKPIDSFDEHYYRLEINRLDALMFDFSILDRNNSDYYFTVFNLSDKIGNGDYWFAFGAINNGAGDGWYILVQDMNLSFPVACVEDWYSNFYNLSCNGTFLDEIIYYLDNNSCGTVVNLPLNNGTVNNTYACVIPPPPALPFNERGTFEFSSIPQALFYIFLMFFWLVLLLATLVLKGKTGSTIQLLNVFQACCGFIAGFGFMHFSFVVGFTVVFIAVGVLIGKIVYSD
jgi:hypothetical protein